MCSPTPFIEAMNEVAREEIIQKAEEEEANLELEKEFQQMEKRPEITDGDD